MAGQVVRVSSQAAWTSKIIRDETALSARPSLPPFFSAFIHICPREINYCPYLDLATFELLLTPEQLFATCFFDFALRLRVAIEVIRVVT